MSMGEDGDAAFVLEENVKQKPLDRLTALGFKTAARCLSELAVKKRKMAIAYEHYRFVREEKIQQFNNALREETKNDRHGYKRLTLTSIEDYKGFPPESVLASLESAIGRKCFDSFQVAHIERVKDPILFGCINECSDRFFIDQWDNDVSIDDLLKANEG